MVEKMEDILHKMPSLIPSVEDILMKRQLVEDRMEWNRKCIVEIRPRILNSFFELDKPLKDYCNSIKDQVVHVLVDEDEGKLGACVPYFESESPDSWIERFIEKNNDVDHFEPIRSALEHLKSFNLEVEGFLLHEVQLALREIDPDYSKDPRIQLIPDDDDRNHAAEVIEENLKDIVFDLAKDIRNAVEMYYKIPNKAGFAAVKNFHDRIKYSSIDSENEYPYTIDSSWDLLFEKWQLDVWPEIYQEYAEKNAYFDGIKQITELFDSFDKDNIFKLMQ
jgi:hypothetical protein